MWKPPTDGVSKALEKSEPGSGTSCASGASGTSASGNGPCDTNSTSQKVEVIDLESLEELQVLNTSSFTAPAPSAVPSAGSTSTAKSPEKPTAESPAATSGSGSQGAPTTGGSTEGSDDKDAASSSLPGQDYSEFIPVERCRGRNLGKIPVETETEATQVASKDPDELQVLNASAASMPDGLDIYGDLCSDLPRTSAQGLAAGLPGKPFRRPRARNLVWKAENPSRPPKDPKVKDDSKAHQVHEVEDDVQLDAAPLQTQQQEAALQKVLAEEAAPHPVPAPGSPVSEEVEDSDDDGSVHLGEVLASQTAARAPPGGPANAVPGSHWTTPVPVVPCAQRPHEGFLLLAGVPGWLTDAELRKHASQFGQVRNLRTLCDSKGKSVGILLLEYSDIQSVRRATEADGICRMRMLQGFGIVPRVMSVSSELHGALCRPAGANLAPWPDGGGCGEELRQKLMDAFGVQPVGSKKRSKAEEAANLTEEIKKLKGVPLASIPAREAPKESKAGEDWAKKLKTVKGAVHPEPKEDGADWAKKLKTLKGAVHPSAPLAPPAPPVAPAVSLAPATPEASTVSWAQKLKKLKGAVNSHNGRG